MEQKQQPENTERQTNYKRTKKADTNQSIAKFLKVITVIMVVMLIIQLLNLGGCHLSSDEMDQIGKLILGVLKAIELFAR